MGQAPGERTRLGPASSLAVCGLLLAAPVALAQEQPWARLGGHAVAAFTTVDPVPGARRLSEVRLVQPMVALEAGALGRLRLRATLGLEGLTIPRGELTAGAWGEGFVDRRHPHTYVHELLLTADDLLGARDGEAALSLTAGKGFAPFGTDDPMMRPSLRYPVNHHLAQILERAVLIAGVRAGPVVAEGGLFNGDEPERPGQWPRIGGRFGDSWSARLIVVPQEGAELQASHARVHSPEHRAGAGTDQVKWSLSAGWNRPAAGVPLSGLVEWARTSEADGFFVFPSLLLEGAWHPRSHRLYYRFERTERPEEERISSFRSRRPHLENSILGTTRWTIHTFGYDLGLAVAEGVALRPLVEVSAGSVRKGGGGLFEVDELYGRGKFWSVTLGVRVSAGSPMPHMGRYGAARPYRAHQH
ncbi:MAG TPA: hypothetical protein VFZ26_00960 [Gemmatimonadales bacterium]